MNAGLLRSRVVIETPTQGLPSQSGQRAKTYAPIPSAPAGVYASIQGLSGSLIEFAKSFAATVDHVVTIRYRADVTKVCRLNYGGRYFTINAAVDRDNTRRFLTILCTEVVS